MLFHSFVYFLAFLPAMAVAVSLLRKGGGPRAAQAVILVGSLFSYARSGPSNVPYLLGSIVANWAFGRWIGRAEGDAAKKRAVTVALVANIAYLATFKYANFFLRALPALGLPKVALPDLGFPLGISFFTLTQIMYLMDCYEGLVQPNDLVEHATFVSFFAYVTSGPLARAKSMMKQLRDRGLSGKEREDQLAAGLYQLAMGLFKKVFFADSFGRVADLGFASPGKLSTLEAWLVSLAYTLQIYFDFSGYSDMAVGSARLLGFDIPKNFDAPYRSKTVTEFWQRWHISLSGFITTYLYTPILQSFRKATLRTGAIATLLAMTIAGLWHGPAWTFIVFGALHGGALVVNLVWKKRKKKLPAPLAWALTFAFVNLAFVFFRSPDLPSALALAGHLVPRPGSPLGSLALVGDVEALGGATLFPALAGGVIAAFFGKSTDELVREHRPSFWTALGTAVMLLVSFLYMNSRILKQFVYFNF
jgi:D-alanyl-lipoteichoic acid acyltransferase DltB (MBOAT superfamily)